jgi:hypothetical protein
MAPPDHYAPCMSQRRAWLQLARLRCAEVRAGLATMRDVREARDNARAWTEMAREDHR